MPDRGGRAWELEPPPPEMPAFMSRDSGKFMHVFWSLFCEDSGKLKKMSCILIHVLRFFKLLQIIYVLVDNVSKLGHYHQDFGKLCKFLVSLFIVSQNS